MSPVRRAGAECGGAAPPLAYNEPMNRLFDKLIVLVCCLAAISLQPFSTATVVATVAAVACAGASEAAEGAPWARSARAALWLAWVACACAVPAAGALLPLAFYDAARQATRRNAAAPAAAGALSLALVCARMDRAGAVPEATLLTALFCAVACLLSFRTSEVERVREGNRRTRDELTERSLSLEAKNRDLLERQDYEVELATLAERARIAREIHDNVGHQLTRAKLQADAYAVVHDDDAAGADFAAVASTMDEALGMVRSSVHALREDSVDLGAQLRKVADSVTADSRLEVALDVAVEHVPANVASYLTAILRESASNTLRHAPSATGIEVRCLEHPSLWQLTVADDGRGEASEAASDGMGLLSMRERVEALGGSFSAGPAASGGWRVFASVPKPTTRKSKARNHGQNQTSTR